MTAKPTEPGTVLFEATNGLFTLRLLQGVEGVVVAFGWPDDRTDGTAIFLENLELRRLREALEKAGE